LIQTSRVRICRGRGIASEIGAGEVGMSSQSGARLTVDKKSNLCDAWQVCV
jgi:hypothetical protein